MGYKPFVSLSIALIGNGLKVVSLARRLTVVGHIVNIGWKESDTKGVIELNSQLKNVVSFTNIAEAACNADAIIITAEAKDVREIAYMLGDVRDKIIIDSTFTIPGPLGENIHTIYALIAITGSPYVVKSFNCTGYRNLIDPLFKGLCVDSFVAGNSIKAKALVRILAQDLGYSNCYDFGDDTTIPLLEEMTICWHNLSLRENMAQKVSRIVTVK
jgi:predicted dinucleotide-binding enzyme